MSSRGFLESLDLIGAPTTWKRLPSKKFQALVSGTTAFEWFHLGTTNTTIREFSELCVQNNFKPPRTGHAGNWRSMIEGWSGALEYNTAICANNRFGAPLVFDMNQTETTDLSGGDTIYRPGSSASRDLIQQLELFCWNGSNFIRVDHECPRFVPFLLTKDGDSFLGLSHWHRRHNISKLWNFVYWSDIVVRRKDLVFSLLKQAFEQCLLTRSNLNLIVDRVASQDGIIHRVDVKMHANKDIFVGDIGYKSVEALVEDCMIPFYAAASPSWWSDNANNQPKLTPILSNYSTMALYALLRTHLLDFDSWTDKVLLHPHWGAIGMAGFPPARHGYFGSQSRYLKKVATMLLSGESDYKSILFMLAPAAIFLLLPSSDSEDDLDCVRSLLERVADCTEKLHSEDVTESLIYEVVVRWRSDCSFRLSPYWESRFQTQRFVANCNFDRTPSSPNVFSEFLDVPMRNLCLILSALDTIYGKKI